jgi:hypothetical protein
MEWIDLDVGKKSWSNFWKTVLYPLCIWILIIMFLYFWLITATNFENLEIFENAIAFIPSIIGSTIGCNVNIRNASFNVIYSCSI